MKEKNVKALCYISVDWDTLPMFKDKGWGDARLHTNDVIKSKWTMEVKKSRYLQSSTDLFTILGYKKKNSKSVHAF